MPLKAKINPASIDKVAQRYVEIIVERTTEKSLDKDGNPFKSYSTRTYAKPAGTITKRGAEELKRQGKLKYFKRNGKLWIVIIGGYAAEREAVMKNSAGDPLKVTLIRTGNMWQNFGVVQIDAANGFFRLGMIGAEQAEKLKYNIEKGRNPMGLTALELNDSVAVKYLVGGIVISGDV